MPHNSDKMLLVEGDGDQRFCKILCDQIGVADIEIAPPRKIGSKGDGKNNAIAMLPGQIGRMKQGDITALGLIVDADYANVEGSLGFKKTWEQIAAHLREAGYSVPNYPPQSSPRGFHFEHPRKLPTVGIWIMPNNGNDGFLEDFITASLKAGESQLLDHAQKIVAALPEQRFKEHHRSKAETATYLAWQTMPGQGLHGLHGTGRRDENCAPLAEFIGWLRKCFN